MSMLNSWQRNVSLAPLTTLGIGGPADYFVEAHSLDELADAVRQAKETGMPYFVLGTGANLLIGDGGFRGLVIHNRAESFEFNGNKLRSDSGAVIADLINASLDKKLSGLEHFVGIPSSVGGALWQNLHFLAPDRQSTLFIETVLSSARILDENLQIHEVAAEFFQFGYDESILRHKPIIVLEATFQLTLANSEDIQKQMYANMQWRRQRQPQLDEFPSCGSVFKKISGVGAGRLIEEAGLKGHRIGDAQISDKHANYIVNLGSAKAADVCGLLRLVQDSVSDNSGYGLEPEISFMGEFT
ncbi:UDP-N-acetylenolpyruvoylglucosamine reductase [Candidatus Saccharibacteria bacterium QS_5_54_17]|nr:MAG: UDP-N-acetylenolpyruvoylglucosamine reductase [Candidatus Saccharibacteria bacterium QS_5_54_17]